MRAPVVEGRIRRRLLVNWRVEPELAASLVPPPFRPQVLNGYAVAGVCLIRLGEMRPKGLPRRLGLGSENAAHRIAVEWDDDGGVHRGVFIPRRDTASVANTVIGGRLFPGVHHRGRFASVEHGDALHVSFTARGGSADVDASVRLASELHGSRLFESLEVASAFFERGSCGYSPTRHGVGVEGVELRTSAWSMRAAVIEHARSSLFDDTSRFPPGSAVLDSALVMLDVPVSWHPIGSVRTALSSDGQRTFDRQFLGEFAR